MRTVRKLDETPGVALGNSEDRNEFEALWNLAERLAVFSSRTAQQNCCSRATSILAGRSVDEIGDAKAPEVNMLSQSATRRGYLAETECSENRPFSPPRSIRLGRRGSGVQIARPDQ